MRFSDDCLLDVLPDVIRGVGRTKTERNCGMIAARRGVAFEFASLFPTSSNGALMRLCEWFLILILVFVGDICSGQDSGVKEETKSQQEPSAENTREQDANKQDTSANDGSEHDGSEHEREEKELGVPVPQDGTLVAADENQKVLSNEEVPGRTMEPHASRVRAVRAIRFSVVVVSVLLSMLTTVVLMQVNRWSHGRYAGRIWWLGVLLVPAWLLVGIVWAWNNAMWNALLDGTLLPF